MEDSSNIIDRILDAYNFSKEAHAGQKRKTGENYIEHCKEVAKILSQYGADEDTIIAGLLHDTVEDNKNISCKDITEKFGDNVAFLVDGVTKAANQQETYGKIIHYSIKDLRVLMIKLADRIHNVSTPINSEEWKLKYYLSTQFYVKLGKVFGLKEMSERLEKLLENLK